MTFCGGAHPAAAAMVRTVDQEADAHEQARWLIEGGVAHRTVTYGRTVVPVEEA